jgi:predicted XRE-type DNA-binding protein
MKTEIIDGEIVRTGGGNVFAQLMHAINTEIRRRGLTQEEAGELVGLKQPELSRISNGRGSGFSADRLIEVLRHLGRDAEITVSTASGPVGELRFRELAR